MRTCQNPSCKKNFNAPLKTINLQQTPPDPYFSCPHCLTEAEPIEELQRIVADAEEDSLEESQQETSQIEPEEKPKINDTAAVCHYHRGYLSERTGKEGIPDDCLVCGEILDCMLKKMHA